MPPKNSRWGVFVFLPALVLTALLLYFLHPLTAAYNPVLFKKIIPWLGLFLSLAAFTAGHFSYPRVHNLKVYLMGYITGLFGIGYFILFRGPVIEGFPIPTVNFVRALLLLVLLDFGIAVALPSFVKYRVARAVTLTIIGVESVFIAVMRFAPHATDWVTVFRYTTWTGLAFWIGPLWFAIVLVLSIWKVRNDFYLGGLIAGCVLIYAVSWSARIGVKDPNLVQMILFSVAPLYLVLGTLVHWFTRMDHRIAYDPLLHIYNRDYCSKIISEQANMNVEPPFTVAMIDIDHFKKVNDTYGHQAGDAVLYTVAQAICRGVIPHGIVCRYGGEELVVFFPQMTTREAAPILESVRTTIEKTKTQAGKKQIKVTVSSGISHREHLSQTVIEVIHAADKALYRAKKGGRNQVRLGKTGVPAAKR
jgi:diguanylate cyclase (GGDEF)-like protein